MVVRSNRLKRWKTALRTLRTTGPDPQDALLCSLILTAVLLFTELFFSQRSNSLLLFCSGLFQFSLTVFIGLRWYSIRYREPRPDESLPLAITLLSSFFLLLLTVYIFLELHLRFSAPVNILTRQALPIMLISLFGNMLILRLLLNSKLIYSTNLPFRLSLSGAKRFFGAALTCLVFIHLTDMNILDTIVGSITGLALFTWAGFTLMDAYWRIRELE